MHRRWPVQVFGSFQSNARGGKRGSVAKARNNDTELQGEQVDSEGGLTPSYLAPLGEGPAAAGPSVFAGRARLAGGFRGPLRRR